MRRRHLLLLALVLAGCTPGEPGAEREGAAAPGPATPDGPAQPAAEAKAAQSGAVADPGDLFGQWQLVSLSGASLVDQPVIHLLVGAADLEAISQCVPFRFPLHFGVGEVSVGDRPGRPGPPLPGARPPAVCARALSPLEQAFPQVMLATRRVEHRPNRRIAFVGDRGEAVIERPASPPTNPFGNRPGPGPRQMWGAWQVAEIDGRPAAPAIDILFKANGIEARSGCVTLAWTFEQVGGALAIAPESWPHPVCERMRSPDEEALARILTGEVSITGASDRERLLTGRAGTIALRR